MGCVSNHGLPRTVKAIGDPVTIVCLFPLPSCFPPVPLGSGCSEGRWHNSSKFRHSEVVLIRTIKVHGVYSEGTSSMRLSRAYDVE